MTYSNRGSIAAIIVLLIIGGYWLYVKKDTAQISADEPKNVQTNYKDLVRPVSSWESVISPLGKGDVIEGTAFDLGLGISRVSVQVQRQSDMAVWDGKQWQEQAGTATDASVVGETFRYTLSCALENDKKYIVRSQAIDAAGNAQLDWAEIVVTGKDLGESSSI